jgi:hypothetical protein
MGIKAVIIKNELNTAASLKVAITPSEFKLRPGEKKTITLTVECDQPHQIVLGGDLADE